MDMKIIAVMPVVLLLLAGAALAAMPNPVETQRGKATVTIPANAAEVAPGVFYLGKVFHEGRIVQGYAFVKYRKEFAKPPWAGGPDKEDKADGCYKLLAKGLKWKANEEYVIDPENNDGLADAETAEWTEHGISAWEAASGFDIFGERNTEITEVDENYLSVLNDRNEIQFVEMADPNIIAVTYVWGYFNAPPGLREIIEFDMAFNDRFEWGDAGDTDENALGDDSVMDYLNIFTHEIGHAAGLGHPDDSCTEETMYRFSQEGETKKRTLNAGDIAGVSALY